jgi:hypothetical protein
VSTIEYDIRSLMLVNTELGAHIVAVTERDEHLRLRITPEQTATLVKYGADSVTIKLNDALARLRMPNPALSDAEMRDAQIPK